MGHGHRPPQHTLRAVSIGHRAQQVLARAQEAVVRGTTSRGLFLQAAGRWLVFLSYERYCSPLTINLNTPAPALKDVEVGDTVLVRQQQLTLSAARVRVLLPGDVWRPTAPSAAIRSFPERVESLKRMTLAVAAAGRERELGLLLRPLLSMPREMTLPAEQRSLLDSVFSLQRGLRAGAGEEAVTIAGRLLGRGRGLTASGDDFLIGFLLFANRHPGAVRLEFSPVSFNRAVVEAAYKKTTTISANLIETAADGHSDERLLAAADCIATGSPPTGDCLAPLLGWGASSGIDALAGMAGAVTL